MSVATKSLLFVYGTLRRDVSRPQNEILSRYAFFFDYGYFRAQLFDLGNYPGTIVSNSRYNRVYGELWSLRDIRATLFVLDKYEGMNKCSKMRNLQYRRMICRISSRHYGLVRAWVYILRRPNYPSKLIPSGDYVLHLSHLSSKRRLCC